ncbi:MAG: MFS transporter [Pseudomonadota bacterium]
MAQTPDARTAGEMVEHSASAPEHHCPKDRRRYVLAAATTVSALGFIDGSVLSVALAAIRSDLPASFAEVQWVSNAYVLTLAALILVGGAAGDRFGQRNTLVVGLIIFIVSSMVCGLAPNASVLIGARLVEGIGAALMVPGSLALIARNYPKAERPAAIGIWAAISGIAAAIGPLIGGLVLSWGGDPAWRWLFYMNVPLGLFAVWLLLARVPVDPAVAGERLDWAGAVLVTGALACLA